MAPKPTLANPIRLDLLPHPNVTWLQQQLVKGGYLKQGDIDGAVGPKTLAAFNAWKEDFYLDQPGVIGQGSIDLLAEIDAKNQISEQLLGLRQQPNPSAGQKTGKQVVLPVVGRVFENQWIDANFPFTWGELTKGLTRLPKDEVTVRNALKLIRAVGLVRMKHEVVWTVNSGYRPKAVNDAIGGAKNSTHIYFRGIDVSPVNLDFRTMLAIARATPEIKGIGLGQKRGFLHFDIGWNDGDRRREFSY